MKTLTSRMNYVGEKVALINNQDLTQNVCSLTSFGFRTDFQLLRPHNYSTRFLHNLYRTKWIKMCTNLLLQIEK